MQDGRHGQQARTQGRMHQRNGRCAPGADLHVILCVSCAASGWPGALQPSQWLAQCVGFTVSLRSLCPEIGCRLATLLSQCVLCKPTSVGTYMQRVKALRSVLHPFRCDAANPSAKRNQRGAAYKLRPAWPSWSCRAFCCYVIRKVWGATWQMQGYFVHKSSTKYR